MASGRAGVSKGASIWVCVVPVRLPPWTPRQVRQYRNGTDSESYKTSMNGKWEGKWHPTVASQLLAIPRTARSNHGACAMLAGTRMKTVSV